MRLTERVRDQNTSNRVEGQVHVQEVIPQLDSQLSRGFSSHKEGRPSRLQ